MVCTKTLLSFINVCDAKTFHFLIGVVYLSQYVLSKMDNAHKRAFGVFKDFDKKQQRTPKTAVPFHKLISFDGVSFSP